MPVDPKIEEPTRKMLGHAIRHELDDLAAVIGEAGDRTVLASIGLCTLAAGYIAIDVTGMRWPSEAMLRKIARNASQSATRLGITEDVIFEFLSRVALGTEKLDDIFSVEGVGTVPIYATANLLLTFCPQDKQWWEYLDQIWTAAEEADKLSVNVLPILMLRARKQDRLPIVQRAADGGRRRERPGDAPVRRVRDRGTTQVHAPVGQGRGDQPCGKNCEREGLPIMPVTDQQAAPLRALLNRQPDEHDRLFGLLDHNDKKTGYQALASAAFVVAVERRFPRDVSLAEVTEFIGGVRSRFPRSAERLDPVIAERLIMGVFNDDSLDDIDARTSFEAQSVLMVIIMYDENPGQAGLDAFLAQARKLADQWLA